MLLVSKVRSPMLSSRSLAFSPIFFPKTSIVLFCIKFIIHFGLIFAQTETSVKVFWFCFVLFHFVCFCFLPIDVPPEPFVEKSVCIESTCSLLIYRHIVDFWMFILYLEPCITHVLGIKLFYVDFLGFLM